MKINDFYKSVLRAANLVVDDNDRVSVCFDGQSQPLLVGGKRLVLPTKEHMAVEDKKEIILFHPLKENILASESDVMARFRQAFNIRANYAIGVLLNQLILLGVSPGMHARLPPEQLDFIKIFKDSDEKTLDAFEALRKVMPTGNQEKSFVRLYLKSKAKIDDKVYRRGSIVSFPLYQELLTGETVWGVKLRKKDRQVIKTLLEYVFPGIENEGSYNRGSQSDTAPTLDAFLRGVAAISDCVNAFVRDLGDVLEDIKDLEIDSAWAAHLDNFDVFAAELRRTPMQAGNEGGLASEVPPAAPAATTLGGWTPPPAAPTAARVAAPVSAPQADTGGVVYTADGKIDMAATQRNQRQQAPAHQQGNAWGTAAAAWGAPMWQQPLSGPEANRASQPSWATPANPFGGGGFDQFGQPYGQPFRI